LNDWYSPSALFASLAQTNGWITFRRRLNSSPNSSFGGLDHLRGQVKAGKPLDDKRLYGPGEFFGLRHKCKTRSNGAEDQADKPAIGRHIKCDFNAHPTLKDAVRNTLQEILSATNDAVQVVEHDLNKAIANQANSTALSGPHPGAPPPQSPQGSGRV
jgi:hypothetical protein